MGGNQEPNLSWEESVSSKGESFSMSVWCTAFKYSGSLPTCARPAGICPATHACPHAPQPPRMHTYVHPRTRTCAPIHMRAHTRTPTRTNRYAHPHMHTHTRTYMHTHTHTHVHPPCAHSTHVAPRAAPTHTRTVCAHRQTNTCTRTHTLAHPPKHLGMHLCAPRVSSASGSCTSCARPLLPGKDEKTHLFFIETVLVGRPGGSVGSNTNSWFLLRS